MDPRGHGGYAESEGVSSQENVNPHSNFPCRPAHRSRQSSYRSKICPPEERAGKHVQFGHFEGKSMAGPLEKQKSFYLVMTGAPCYRQESFAVKDSAWFGGAGSVRGLVRQYESQRDLTKDEISDRGLPVDPRTFRRSRYNSSSQRDASSRQSSGERFREFRNIVTHPSAPCLTSTDTSNSNSNGATHSTSSSSGDKNQNSSYWPTTLPNAPMSSQDDDESSPPLNPHPFQQFSDERIAEIPTAPPLTASSDVAFPPPPEAWLAHTTHQQRKRSSSLMFPSDVPENMCSRRGGVHHCAIGDALPPRAPPPPLRFASSFPSVKTVITSASNVETKDVYSGKGEGVDLEGKYAATVGSKEGSERSRMGDYDMVGAAVGEMSNRLKKREYVPASKRVYRMAASARRSDLPRPDKEPSKPSTTSLPNISRSRQCHHGNGESRWLGNDELDKILFNVDHRPVNYYRCEDPTPETDASASAEWCLSECNIIPPKPQYRNMGVQVSELPDACQVLKFDSDGRSSFGTCGDGNRKTSRHCRRHLFRQESAYNDFYKNKRGEVIFRTDAQRGYEFSSRISMRTSDLNSYTITQTKKELRTGHSVTKRRHVHGAGVTQRFHYDYGEPVKFLEEDVDDDTLQTLSFDENSDEFDGGGSGFAPGLPQNQGEGARAYENGHVRFFTNTPMKASPKKQEQRTCFCCFPVFGN